MTATQVFLGLRAVTRPPARPVVTVGVFDGVHIAHQQLLRSAIALAKRLKGTSVVVTFDPDPHVVLNPDHAPLALMPLQERVRWLSASGVDWIWVVRFTRRFSRMSAEQFVRRILVHRLHAAAVVVGETFVFGKNRAGDMGTLQRLGPPHGMRVVSVRPIRCGGRPVSSSRIRQLIARGALAEARRLLGRPPALYGTVVRGAGRGDRLGFPTANIRLIPQVLPPRGVYAVILRHRGSGRTWQGVMNLGVRPTFGPGPVVCETHLFGFRGSLMGRQVAVSLPQRLRGEQRFASPDALIAQIHRDIARARRLFARSS